MGHRVEKVRGELENIDIMFGGRNGDRFFRMIAGIGSISHPVKINSEIFGGYKAEEGKVPYRGDF